MSKGSPIHHVCVVCQKPSRFWCGKCHEVPYCGRMHQSEHWILHRSECQSKPIAPDLPPHSLASSASCGFSSSASIPEDEHEEEEDGDEETPSSSSSSESSPAHPKNEVKRFSPAVVASSAERKTPFLEIDVSEPDEDRSPFIQIHLPTPRPKTNLPVASEAIDTTWGSRLCNGACKLLQFPAKSKTAKQA